MATTLFASFQHRSRESRLPALGGAAVLHIGLAALGWLGFITAKAPKAIEVTPISLVTASDLANARAAMQAPKNETAQSPTPTPPVAEQKPPTPPAPQPKPAPPTPAPAPPKPQQALNLDQLSRQPPQPKLNLDQLSKTPRSQPKTLDLASLADNAPSGGPVNAQQRGPARVETAEVARKAVGAGNGLSADARSYLAAKLIKLWNPNCGVEDAANVVVRVNIKLSMEGRVISVRDMTGQEDSIVHAAAVRALTAVKQAEPYDGLPHDQYAAWRDVNFNFIAKDACRR